MQILILMYCLITVFTSVVCTRNFLEMLKRDLQCMKFLIQPDVVIYEYKLLAGPKKCH